MLVRTSDAALIAHVQPGTVRMWVARGHIHRYRGGMVDLLEIQEYLAKKHAFIVA